MAVNTIEQELDYLIGAALKCSRLPAATRTAAESMIQRRKQALKRSIAEAASRQFEAGLELGRVS